MMKLADTDDKLLLAVTVVVLDGIALGFQGIVLVFNFRPAAPGRDDLWRALVLGSRLA